MRDHRIACGHRFRVKDGRVAAKEFVYGCPFCEVTVASSVKTVQIDHRLVCGNQFYVKEGTVSAQTRQHLHRCPACGLVIAVVWTHSMQTQNANRKILIEKQLASSRVQIRNEEIDLHRLWGGFAVIEAWQPTYSKGLKNALYRLWEGFAGFKAGQTAFSKDLKSDLHRLWEGFVGFETWQTALSQGLKNDLHRLWEGFTGFETWQSPFPKGLKSDLYRLWEGFAGFEGWKWAPRISKVAFGSRKRSW